MQIQKGQEIDGLELSVYCRRAANFCADREIRATRFRRTSVRSFRIRTTIRLGCGARDSAERREILELHDRLRLAGPSRKCGQRAGAVRVWLLEYARRLTWRWRA